MGTPDRCSAAKLPKLSIVTTFFRSRNFVARFYDEACRVAGALNIPFEIVFVNDGSPDDSFDVAHALQQRDRRVKLVDLSRNFGHHRALMAGFAFASGDLVYVTDIDLESRWTSSAVVTNASSKATATSCMAIRCSAAATG